MAACVCLSFLLLTNTTRWSGITVEILSYHPHEAETPTLFIAAGTTECLRSKSSTDTLAEDEERAAQAGSREPEPEPSGLTMSVGSSHTAVPHGGAERPQLSAAGLGSSCRGATLTPTAVRGAIQPASPQDATHTVVASDGITHDLRSPGGHRHGSSVRATGTGSPVPIGPYPMRRLHSDDHEMSMMKMSGSS